MRNALSTGKSLSIICAALSWLKSAQQKHDNCEPVTTDENVPDWIREQVQQASKKQLQKVSPTVNPRQLQSYRVEKRRLGCPRQQDSKSTSNSDPAQTPFDADQEAGQYWRGVQESNLLQKLNQDDFIVTFEEEDSLFDAATSSSLLDLDRQDLPEPPDNPIKIFYCSRTVRILRANIFQTCL